MAANPITPEQLGLHDVLQTWTPHFQQVGSLTGLWRSAGGDGTHQIVHPPDVRFFGGAAGPTGVRGVRGNAACAVAALEPTTLQIGYTSLALALTSQVASGDLVLFVTVTQ